MVVRISKMFDFDAAHYLPLLPPEHKCSRMHGHTYRVEVICTGPLDHLGMVVDYAYLTTCWKPLHHVLDHRLLNEIPGLECPTTENLARFIFDHLALTGSLGSLLTAVRTYESATTWCEVTQ